MNQRTANKNDENNVKNNGKQRLAKAYRSMRTQAKDSKSHWKLRGSRQTHTRKNHKQEEAIKDN
jgi:hypothetical protein